MTIQIVEVTTTVGSDSQSKTLAEGAIERRLAACVQIEGPIQSVYRWKDAIETNMEFRIHFKSSLGRLMELVEWLHAQHPYEIAEIKWQTVHSTESYRNWVDEETQPL